MPVTSFDRNTLRYEGAIFLPQFESSFVIKQWELIRDDLLPLAAFTTNTRLSFQLYTTPLLKVTSDLGSFPFINTPDTRYKFGSYSYGSLQEIVIDPEGLVTTFPYSKEPYYIIYPRQQLKQSYVCINLPESTDFDYFANFDEPTQDLTNVAITRRTINTTAYPDCDQGNFLFLNLPQGVIADILIYYQGFVASIPNSEPRIAFQSVL